MSDPNVYTVYRLDELVNYDLLFRAKANQIKIFKNRGFTISDDESKYTWTTPREYRKAYRAFERKVNNPEQNVCDYLSGIYEKESTDERVYVAFINNAKNETSDKTKELINNVNLICVSNDINKVFAIIGEKINKDNLASFDLIGTSWEIYRKEDMSVDRSAHVLDTKYEVLNDDEKQDFLERTKISACQIARYKTQNKRKKHRRDPILQNLQLQRGTLVKLTRENHFVPTVAKETIAYRIVY